MMLSDFIQSKIVNTQSLTQKLLYWRFKEEKVVFTNGCFDLLHQGHVNYLCEAASLGDRLIVAVNSDDSVSKLKGPNRPLQDEISRCRILASLLVTDAVIIFNEETPLELIQLVKPDFLVKGGDWRAENIVGYDVVKKYNGVVKSLPFTEGYSTTGIEQKIKAQVK